MYEYTVKLPVFEQSVYCRLQCQTGHVYTREGCEGRGGLCPWTPGVTLSARLPHLNPHMCYEYACVFVPGPARQVLAVYQ